MDVKEMREVAESVSEHTACGCDPQIGVWSCPHCDARYLAKLMLVLTCPDPLTLDAAVKVMGREPDERFTSDRADQMHFKEGFAVVDYKNGNVMLSGQGKYWRNPTIGQFACLAAAARMGEQS